MKTPEAAGMGSSRSAVFFSDFFSQPTSPTRELVITTPAACPRVLQLAPLIAPPGLLTTLQPVHSSCTLVSCLLSVPDTYSPLVFSDVHVPEYKLGRVI